jgi:cathepsin A (carboxypeptidase C)
VQHSAFPNYRLRVVEPSICDPSVKQLSGYLDISDSKHLFFWFEESRHKPKDDPLVLWLNGGPGCSSTTGLLFELGGCSVTDEGNNVTRNENSWNDVANVLFLDQPVGVGYSYSEDGGINNSPAAAEDVYAFLILFISQVCFHRSQL